MLYIVESAKSILDNTLYFAVPVVKNRSYPFV